MKGKRSGRVSTVFCMVGEGHPAEKLGNGASDLAPAAAVESADRSDLGGGIWGSAHENTPDAAGEATRASEKLVDGDRTIEVGEGRDILEHDNWNTIID